MEKSSSGKQKKSKTVKAPPPVAHGKHAPSRRPIPHPLSQISPKELLREFQEYCDEEDRKIPDWLIPALLPENFWLSESEIQNYKLDKHRQAEENARVPAFWKSRQASWAIQKKVRSRLKRIRLPDLDPNEMLKAVTPKYRPTPEINANGEETWNPGIYDIVRTLAGVIHEPVEANELADLEICDASSNVFYRFPTNYMAMLELAIAVAEDESKEINLRHTARLLAVIIYELFQIGGYQPNDFRLLHAFIAGSLYERLRVEGKQYLAAFALGQKKANRTNAKADRRPGKLNVRCARYESCIKQFDTVSDRCIYVAKLELIAKYKEMGKDFEGLEFHVQNAEMESLKPKIRRRIEEQWEKRKRRKGWNYRKILKEIGEWPPAKKKSSFAPH